MTMPTTINSKILLSGAAIVAAAALVIGATFAFFSDTEESLGNTLQAGALDLQIDSEAHYAGLVCTQEGESTTWQQEASTTTRPELIDQECEGTWALKDLEEGDTFFELLDLKPGDEGENTVSLHVFDNDAWGRIRVTNILDKDNDCTEPEIDTGATDPECELLTPGQLVEDTELNPDDGGELSENLNFFLWLDEGTTPGFQCANPTNASPAPDPLGGAECAEDPEEGNNVFDAQVEEPTTANSISLSGEDIIINLAPGLAEAYGQAECDGAPADGHNGYGLCHGLASDGRLVGSATYYIGVAWELDPATGNEAQTDSISADIAFDITQQRNQPNPYLP